MNCAINLVQKLTNSVSELNHFPESPAWWQYQKNSLTNQTGFKGDFIQDSDFPNIELSLQRALDNFCPQVHDSDEADPSVVQNIVLQLRSIFTCMRSLIHRRDGYIQVEDKIHTSKKILQFFQQNIQFDALFPMLILVFRPNIPSD